MKINRATSSRRTLLKRSIFSAGSIGLGYGLMPLTIQSQQTPKDLLVFLGTQGGPNYNLHRGESATAVVIENKPYLIDCGYGTLRALMQAQLPFLDVGQIFLTHLHDDHIADLVAIVGHQWTQGRILPSTIFGPYGTEELVTAAINFNQANTRIRLVDEARSLLPKDLFFGVSLEASSSPKEIFKDERVTVHSIENTHYSDSAKLKMPDRSLAYRFDSNTRSVVFSGDTSYSKNLIQLSKDADFLVCEVIDVASMRIAFDNMVASGGYGDNPEGIWNHIVKTHTSTEDAGRMAQEANVKTLVVNHLSPGALQDIDDQVYTDKIAKYFSGNIVVANDQMVL